MRMNVRHFAAAALVAVLAVMAVGATSASGGKAADTLTVWLQVDAQSGWPEVVAAANAQFRNANPGWDVDVQYKGWPTHLQQFDAALAGGNAPDVKEMGNTEMTKYMAAGAFQDLTSERSSFPNSSTWLEGLAASARYGGKLYGVPYYAGSRVVTYRTDLFRQAGVAKLPTSLAEFTAAAKKLGARNKDKAFSPVYIAGTDWYVAMSFVYDYGGKIAITNKGKWIGTLDRPKAIAGLTAFKNFFNAASRAQKTTIETRPNPYDVYAQGNAASMIGPVRHAEPHQGAADARLPRRLRPRGPGRRRQGEGRCLDPRVHGQRLDDRPSREGQHPEHDQPSRYQRQRASCPPQLVRAVGEALGQRGEWEHPPHDAGPDPHQQDDRQAGGGGRQRQHRLHAEPEVGTGQGTEDLVDE
jgi:ABC-type glycerol-3-phosphate transport system substrate-binding protein